MRLGVHKVHDSTSVPTPPLALSLDDSSLYNRDLSQMAKIVHIYTIDRPRFPELNALLVDPLQTAGE